MSKHERMARIEGINLETGAFDMTLATEGEASDGDILSIKGGQIPERMPMLTSHWNDPTAALGSITDPQKLLKDSPPRLRAVGHIEMGGEGPSAEIRRDLAHMIDKGHVTGVSIRWDAVSGKPPTRRVNLPSDHPYFVDSETEKDQHKRYGLFFEEWRAMEGSVVALGADPQALIGRADETEGELSTYWRGMADDSIEGLEGRELDRLGVKFATCDEDIEKHGGRIWIGPSAKPKESEQPNITDPEADAAAALAALRMQLVDCRDAGVTVADLLSTVGEDLTLEEQVAIVKERLPLPTPQPTEEDYEQLWQLLERLEAAEARATAAEAALEEERVRDDPAPSTEQERVDTGDPLQPLVTRPREVMALLHEELEAASQRVDAKFRAEVEKARGRIDQ